MALTAAKTQNDTLHSKRGISLCKFFVAVCDFCAIMSTKSCESQPPRKLLRKDNDVFLVGHSTHQILGAKLPLNKQVLAVFFYNLRSAYLSVKESAL